MKNISGSSLDVTFYVILFKINIVPECYLFEYLEVYLIYFEILFDVSVTKILCSFKVLFSL